MKKILLILLVVVNFSCKSQKEKDIETMFKASKKAFEDNAFKQNIKLKITTNRQTRII